MMPFQSHLLVLAFVLAFTPPSQQSPASKIDSTEIDSTQMSSISRDDSLQTAAGAEGETNSGTWMQIYQPINSWLNEHPGLLAFLGLVLTFFGVLIAYRVGLPQIRSYRERRKATVGGKDTRTLEQRYLGHVIAAHQYLPVAGFETNLRVPIPLEDVYVELRARIAEVERLRDPEAESMPDQVQDVDRIVDVREALQYAVNSRYDGIVILGDPGSGKTTLARYFLICFANNAAKKKLKIEQSYLPILLFLRDIDPEKSIVQNILSPLQKHDLGLDESFFLPYLQEGRALLLLDGLDEVASESKRHAVSRWIYQTVHLNFPRCPLIVTSRFSGYLGDAVLQGHFLRLEIQDYGLDQVEQFIKNWLHEVETHLHSDKKHAETLARNAARDLFESIKTTKALRELAINPLMLQIIALVHRDRNTLPDRRVELYRECTDVLLERWDKAKGLDVLLSASEARQLLQPVALWMHSVENRREVKSEELKEYIKPIVPRIKREVDLDALLESWVVRSGIFKGEGDTYFFYHLSFQEYLTAEEIRNTRKLKLLSRHFDQAWWREPTLLAMGLTNPTIFADFMHLLLRDRRKQGISTDFLLRCIDEALVRDESPFLEGLETLRRFEALYTCLLALQRIGTDMAKDGLRKARQHADRRIALEAQSLLAKWGEAPIPVPEIVEPEEIAKAGAPALRRDRYFNAIENNAEYILIPGTKERGFKSKDQPVLPSLYFAKVPVTNQLYRRMIAYLAGDTTTNDLQKILPLSEFAHILLNKVEEEKDFIKFLGDDKSKWLEQLRSKAENEKRFNDAEQPVVRITWYAAMVYCHWLTALSQAKDPSQTMSYRLPNEHEWQWAASGGAREYPWGDEQPDDSRANYGNKVGQTTPVGIYPAGATPEGLLDMAGNVWEWTDSLWKPDSSARVVRGGSFYHNSDLLRCANRYGNSPDYRNSIYGFRVVASHVSEL